MVYFGKNARKINKARRLSEIGVYRESFSAMLAAIPDPVIEALTARQLADLIDANWRLAGASKRLAGEEAVVNGFVWDHNRSRAIDLAL